MMGVSENSGLNPQKEGVRGRLYLSDRRTLFLGCVGQNLSSANAAPLMLVSLGEDLELLLAGQREAIKGRSFLVPAGVQFKANTVSTDIALAYLDPVGDDLDALGQETEERLEITDGAHIFRGIRQEEDVVTCMQVALGGNAPDESIFEALQRLAGSDRTRDENAAKRDERVVKAAAIIKERYVENLSVEEVAGEVGLSVPRLIQLFKRKTGVPIRRFRMWQRIFVTILKVAEGLTLTEAAVAAGFSDYAHFSRNFKEMSGVNPSDVLSLRGGIQLHLSSNYQRVFHRQDLLPE